MSIAEPAALYQEKTEKISPHEDVDRCIADLVKNKGKLKQLPISRLVDLTRQCLDGAVAHAKEWSQVACKAKGIDPNSPLSAEDLGNGPLTVTRYLRLLMQSLQDIEQTGTPQLPGKVFTGPDGRLRVQVVPTKGMFDSLLFSGFAAHVWMQPGVTKENLRENMASYYRNGRKSEGVALVLGAGNVSSIAAIDAFNKLFHEGKVVLLKMNPVNEYVGPIFEKAFKCLIDEGFLRIIYGGADVGSHAIHHDDIDEVHITGSVFSHDTIVWGPPGEERERRKADGNPLLKKTITSELGNVSPWICVPGPYTDKELDFQAENLASTVVNNASFNCVATKMIVTWKNWPQRQRFLDSLQRVLDTIPRRKAYYPGACDRYAKFAGKPAEGTELPWILKRDVDPEKDPLYFDEESFVCVFAETAIDADSEADFLDKATKFCNDRLWGTLGCSIMIHPKFRQQPGMEDRFQKCLSELRYGSIGVNLWSAMSYAMVSPPWGGYPGGTIEDPRSGIGWVHNTYMFDKPEKTVVEGPLTAFPKPLWFPSVRTAHEVTWKVLGLYHQPSVFKLPSLFLSALKG